MKKKLYLVNNMKFNNLRDARRYARKNKIFTRREMSKYRKNAFSAVNVPFENVLKVERVC